MSGRSLSLFVSLLVRYILLLPASSGEWTLKSGVQDCEGDRAVYWFYATNTSNFFHFVFAADTHVRPPAVLMIHSPFDGSHVEVNCSQYNVNTSFRHSVVVEAATASYGMILFQICDYLDLDDSAKIPSNTECHRYYGSNLKWSPSKFEQTSPNTASLTFHGTQLNESHDQFLDGGFVGITFTVYDSEGTISRRPYYNVAPGLAIEIIITVDRLKVLYSKTRIAPVLFVFSNQSLEDDDDFVLRSTWSDGPLGKRQSSYLVLNERTRAGVVGTDHPPAFIHFSPVSSVCQAPDDGRACLRSASIGPRMAIVHKGNAHKYSHSLVYAYYGDRFNQVHETSHRGRVGAREQFINLGDPGDGAYAATNYSSWSLVLSFGHPLTESADSGSTTSWIAATSVIVLVSASTAFGVWRYRLRRRTKRADHSVIRIEPAARLALESQGSRATESEPVEPFMMRKTLFPFRRRRSSDSSDKPLLVAPPPAYNSLFDGEPQGTFPS